MYISIIYLLYSRSRKDPSQASHGKYSPEALGFVLDHTGSVNCWPKKKGCI